VAFEIALRCAEMTKKRKPPKRPARATDVHATDDQFRQQRERLIEMFFDEALTSHDRSVANGVVDAVVVILDIHDPFARAFAKLAGLKGTDEAHEEAERTGQLMARCVTVERTGAIKVLEERCPQLESLAPQPLDENTICIVALSAAGSKCEIFRRKSAAN
jgi:hypothetical protein